jgi:predicted extracellular nuclease
MATTTRSRTTGWRRGALALVASFVPVIVSGSQPAAAAASDLFISEYVEGSSFNKAIEIYNGTGATVDLAAASYELELYSNGAAAPSQSLALSGTIADGDVLVLANSQADPAILAVADVTGTSVNAVINFNGDDAVVLRKGDAVIDAFGQVGVDPGSQWTGGGQDDTLRRKEAICAGDVDAADAFDASVEWDGFAVDTFDGLGLHTATCDGGGTDPVDPVINEFSASTAGADVEYVEIIGTPSADLSGFAILEIEGDAPAVGTIDEVIQLGTTDAAGLYLASLPANALENGTLTLLLVEGFNGTLGTDLDTDDDGVLDTTPFAEIVDAVAVDDGGAGDVTYSAAVLGPNYDGLSNFAPGGASRIPDGTDTDTPSDWVRNDFDLAGIDGFSGSPVVGEAINTPGAPNEVVVPPPAGVCGEPATLISSIQGAGDVSPLAGQTHTVEAVVVGDFQDGAAGTNGDLNGFHVQEEDADADGDPLSSEGIFVFEGSNPAVDVQVGDRVRVVGPVSEFNGLTEISTTAVAVCDSGVAAPTPAVLTLPVTAVSDFERYEGMSVTFPQALVISEYFNFDRFGEIVLTTERRLTPTAEFEPGPDAVDAADDFLLNRITLDDGRTSQNPDPAIHPNGDVFDLDNLFRGGDTVANVTGVLDYSFDLYRVQPTQGADYTSVNERTATPDDVGGDIRVASFNVLNYFTTIDDGTNDICGPNEQQECRGADSTEELERQRAKIVAALTAIDADVVGLIEIENNLDDDAVIDLVASLNAATAPGTYDYVATGAIGSDAIKVAIIYQPSAVTPVGAYALLDSSVDSRFIDARNRPVLAQSFADAAGNVFTVAVNHLKSKGSACLPDDPDLGDGSANCNGTRTAAAEALVDWLATDPTGSASTDTLIIGDLNAYDKETPIDAIVAGADDTAGTGDDYTDLVLRFQGEDAYSYVFDGQVGYLDHALASASLLDRITGTTVWHVNADEADLLDYDTSFKQDAQDALFAPDPYRSSDHDPVIVGLQFDTPRDLKESVAADLAAALPTGDRWDDRLIGYAIDRIEQSLEPSWWLDDGTLDPKDGKKVFDRDRQAIVLLLLVDLAVADEAIADLLEAQRQLVATQIQLSTDAGGDPRDLARAQRAFADAERATEIGWPLVATIAYKFAWSSAIRAVR